MTPPRGLDPSERAEHMIGASDIQNELQRLYVIEAAARAVVERFFYADRLTRIDIVPLDKALEGK